jgi:hypothetical protein
MVVSRRSLNEPALSVRSSKTLASISEEQILEESNLSNVQGQKKLLYHDN